MSDTWIENPVNKVHVKIINTRKQYLKWSLKLPFRRERQFCNRAITIEKEKCKINLDKPDYIGASILELSKVLV